jgi:hypothetical protein
MNKRLGSHDIVIIKLYLQIPAVILICTILRFTYKGFIDKMQRIALNREKFIHPGRYIHHDSEVVSVKMVEGGATGEIFRRY